MSPCGRRLGRVRYHVFGRYRRTESFSRVRSSQLPPRKMYKGKISYD